MRMYEVAKPITAYVFELKNGNIRFAELEADVKKDGGFVERKADDLVVITVAEGVFTLPLGFAVVIENGVGRTLKSEIFHANFAEATEVSEVELDYDKVNKELEALTARVTELEKQTPPSESKAKGKSKTKTAETDEESGGSSDGK